MILEGLVTTTNADGTPHLAPMGPKILGEFESLLLRPFPSSHTFQNLRRQGQGVLHVVDDVLLLAQAAVGQAQLPEMERAIQIEGFLMRRSACRAYEFQVESLDESHERIHILARVVTKHWFRDFWGFNRAKHAVIEAAILATRLHLTGKGAVLQEYAKLIVWVNKTGGEREIEAMQFLQDFVKESP